MDQHVRAVTQFENLWRDGVQAERRLVVGDVGDRALRRLHAVAARRPVVRDRTDRRRLYENLLAEGDQHMMMRWVDGALLVDVWTELVLPAKIRAAWESAVEAASAGRGLNVFQYHA